jgi:hypothetical protein
MKHFVMSLLRGRICQRPETTYYLLYISFTCGSAGVGSKQRSEYQQLVIILPMPLVSKFQVYQQQDSPDHFGLSPQ